MHTKEYFMKEALKEANKAKANKEVPIGAVIVLGDRIIARGHNTREMKQNSLCHAEINAINKACKKLKNFRLQNCELYVTIEPCLMCSGAIIQSRISKVIYGADDMKYGAVTSIARSFELDSNHKVQYERGILKEQCTKIVSDFFKELRVNKKNNMNK